ncbi:MAG: rhodanese-related sulfurtransferase [Pseudohongiellaceae bacterium]|jgi:rhodanese-related sulfurtransferase
MIELIVTASLSSFLFGLFGVSWESVDAKIANEYPQVEFITTDDLFSIQSSQPSSSFQLFDVRESEEYSVSHLSDSQNVSKASSISAIISDKSTPIVVYCSVGYRSAAVAAQLQELGYSNVLNLRHSIFEWVEKGYPLLNKAGDTNKVHPYNRAWGALIDTSYHFFPN